MFKYKAFPIYKKTQISCTNNTLYNFWYSYFEKKKIIIIKSKNNL